MENYESIAKKVISGYYDNKSNIEVTLKSDVAVVVTYLNSSKIQNDYYWKDGEKETFIERM